MQEVKQAWQKASIYEQGIPDRAQRQKGSTQKLELARNVKGNKKGFYKYSISKRKAKENMCPLLTGARNLIAKDIKKTKELSAFLASVFYGQLDIHKSMEPDEMTLRVPDDWKKANITPIFRKENPRR
ncbi:hypothetical protein QYF61_024271 [Mycteria americana]|uniref:Uncharacterized protein n=1 Tax=Mycteria americana TaxID=33587 RepID=A0AAN7RRJ6_MYCAM|nr:hypothetical protein QYF61_024271 [Mycteria americana]